MVPFGWLLHDQSSLESMVRRAKIAVFLDEDEFNQVLGYTDTFIFGLHSALTKDNPYTRHAVHVVYQNPDIPFEATFVDLPGP